MPLMPAFRYRRKDAAAIGRMIVGYGELELVLSFCLGTALASKRIATAPQRVKSPYLLRAKYEDLGIKVLFRERGETKRLKNASQTMRPEFSKFDLLSDFDEAMNAMWVCKRYRDAFAHCHWDYSPRKRGLFLINLEDAAKESQNINMGKFRHAKSADLEDLEAFFWYTLLLIEYLRGELAVKAGLLRSPYLSRPRKMSVPTGYKLLFQYKDLRRP